MKATRNARSHHNAKFYLKKIISADELAQVDMLLFEAALQPRSVLPDKEYEKIYWLAQSRLQGGGELCT